MTCPQATGLCTITPDGSCSAPKTLNPLLEITGVSIVNVVGGRFLVSWDKTPGDNDLINTRYRLFEETTFTPRVFYVRSEGGFLSDVIGSEDVVLMMRAETDTEYGNWQRYVFTTGVDEIPYLNFEEVDNSQYIGVVI